MDVGLSQNLKTSRLCGLIAFAPRGRTFARRANTFANMIGRKSFVAHQTHALLLNMWTVRSRFFVIFVPG